jgi:hypothetical protein
MRSSQPAALSSGWRVQQAMGSGMDIEPTRRAKAADQRLDGRTGPGLADKLNPHSATLALVVDLTVLLAGAAALLSRLAVPRYVVVGQVLFYDLSVCLAKAQDRLGWPGGCPPSGRLDLDADHLTPDHAPAGCRPLDRSPRVLLGYSYSLK